MEDDLEDLHAKQHEIATRILEFEMRSDTLEKNKEKLLAESVRKGKTIKKLREELKFSMSSYLRSEDFTEVKVHSLLDRP